MRTVSPIVYASVAALLLACSDSTGPSQPGMTRTAPDLPTGTFQVSPATATLQYGQTLRFTTTYSGNPALSATPGDVAWYSTDENVAPVSSGLVRGVSGGEARIVATSGGHRASALVTVAGPWKKHDDPGVCMKRTQRAGQRLMTQC
jgi:uncharacterized protein YjdB